MKAWVKGIIAGAVIAAIGVAVFIGGLWFRGSLGFRDGKCRTLITASRCEPIPPKMQI